MRNRPEFPHLGEADRYQFPSPEDATPEGIVGVGGNLSPGMLLSAYRQGIFPWYSDGEPILWWSPDPRFVLFPGELHVSRSLRRLLRSSPFRFSADTCFDEVIRRCSSVARPGQPGTWITKDMVTGYRELHRLGYAHSVEAWHGDELVGGLYGVSVGTVFCGESMFRTESNASKAAFAVTVPLLETVGVSLIDCQVHTEHVERFGARKVPRATYLSLLSGALGHPTLRGSWAGMFKRSLSKEQR